MLFNVSKHTKKPPCYHTARDMPKEEIEKLYPSTGRIVKHTAIQLARGGILGALACYVTRPVLVALVTATESFLGISEWTATLSVALAIHSLVCFGANLFFYLCDRNKWLQHYKMPRHRDHRVNTPSEQLAFLGQICFYHFVVRIIEGVALFWYMPYPSVHDPLPPLVDIAVHYAVSLFAGEILLYCTHRAFHASPLMFRMHRVHHAPRVLEAGAAEFSHPLEQTLFTVLNHVATSQHHITIHLVMTIWKMFELLETHSGYSFRKSWLNQKFGLLNGYRAEFHDYHHQADDNGTYGGHLFLDFFCRTCDGYLVEMKRRGLSPLD